MSFERVEHTIETAVQEGVFPGAVLLVRQGRRFFYLRAFGWRSLIPRRAAMEEDTVFDVASLTKPLATSVALMLLVQEGKVALEDRVARYIPNFGVHEKERITLRQLLSHCSGLPAWRPYFRDVLQEQSRWNRSDFLGSPKARTFVYDRIVREPLESAPGEKTVYSDLGFMLLGAVVEQVSGMSLDHYCVKKIFAPLGLSKTGFLELAGARTRRATLARESIAATEDCPWRKKVLCGEVHDDNAYAMGGVAGHAGLFSCARDMDALLCVLSDSYDRSGGFIAQPIVREFWSRDASVRGSTWCLGWDSPSLEGSAAGRYFSPNSVGHLGFTGCSIWLDLEEHIHVILLTNRVHPRRDNDRIRHFRPKIHDYIREALADGK